MKEREKPMNRALKRRIDSYDRIPWIVHASAAESPERWIARRIGERIRGWRPNYFFLPPKIEAMDLALFVTMPLTSAVI